MPEETRHLITVPNGAGELILIVDDDPLVKMLVERVLTSEGYRVITASDGFQAIEIYNQHQSVIDLVILDFKMPGMDGLTLFNELLVLNPKVPAALTSGFVEDEQLDAMRAKGLRGFIPKPLTQQKLLQKVRGILDGLKHGAPGNPDQA